MRIWLLALAVALVPAAARAQAILAEPVQSPAVPADKFEAFIDYAVRSPVPYVYALSGAIFDQLVGFPREWTGASGFARLNAAHLGQGFSANAIQYSAAALLHHHTAYEVCTCTGARARASHGIVRAFVSMRDDGGSAPNWSMWLGKYAAAGLANAWYPDSYHTRDVFRQATGAIGVAAALNLVKEFEPELLHVAHLK